MPLLPTPAGSLLQRPLAILLVALSALLFGCGERDAKQASRSSGAPDMWGMNYLAISSSAEPSAPDGFRGVIAYRVGGKARETAFDFPASSNSGAVTFRADELLYVRVSPTRLARPVHLTVIRLRDETRHAHARVADASAGFELTGPFDPQPLQRRLAPSALRLGADRQLSGPALQEKLRALDPALRPSRNTGYILTASSQINTELHQLDLRLDEVLVHYSLVTRAGSADVVGLDAHLTFPAGHFERDETSLATLADRYLRPVLDLLLQDADAAAWLREELLRDVGSVNSLRSVLVDDFVIAAGRHDPIQPGNSERVHIRLAKR